MCTLTTNTLTYVLNEQEVGYDLSTLEHKYRPLCDSRRRALIIPKVAASDWLLETFRKIVVSGVNTNYYFSKSIR